MLLYARVALGSLCETNSDMLENRHADRLQAHASALRLSIPLPLCLGRRASGHRKCKQQICLRRTRDGMHTAASVHRAYKESHVQNHRGNARDRSDRGVAKRRRFDVPTTYWS